MPKQATKTKKSAPASRKSGTNNKSSSTSNASQQNTMLEKFVVDQLKDIYYAEKQLLKALPKMEKAATTEELKTAFRDHAAVTQEQIGRLEQAFEIMGKKAQGKKCEAMEGLIAESQSIIEETEKGTMTRDVALIMAAQKVEHYEIASYGGLAQITRTMGLTEVSDLMEETLAEEKETDQLLTSIAENDINLQAEEEGSEDEED
jgi:ferritin-like metal-binding protein YciE